MVKKSLVWLYSVTTYLLWTVIIVVASVVLGLRYYVLPHIKNYKDAIATTASNVVGQKITIGNIEAHWDGLNPNLELFKVNILDQQNQPALQLDHVETSLSWLSLPLLEPRLAKLVIRQPNLLIRRTPDGNIFIAGILMNKTDTSEPVFPNWLLRQSSIDVDHATVVWQDELRNAPPLALNDLSLHISTPPWEGLLGHHRFGLRATPSAGASSQLDVRGNIWGKDVDKAEQWRGTIYAKMEGTDIAAWRTWVDYPFELTQGLGATQFWLDFAGGQAKKVTADTLLINVRAQFGHNTPEVGLQNLSGRLTWQLLTDGNELHGERLKFATTDGFSMKNGALRIASHRLDGKESLEGEASLDEIALEPFATFVGNLPLGKELQQQLTGLAPKGSLQQVALNWKGDRNVLREYSIRSRFAGLGISTADGIPGFTGLSGTLDATQTGGGITIDAHNASLDLKGVLRWPIPADNLTGQVKWKNSNGVMDVRVSNLAISSPHLAGTLNASYHYDGKKGGYLDLIGKFGNADGKFAHYYYPTVLSKETLEWLDTSILSGHGEDVNVVIKGYLDDFPYPNNKNGEFKVSAKITNGLLDYADGWPKIDGMGVDLLFHGNRMDLNVTQGRIYGGQITRAKVAIPALDADHPVVEIQGEVQAPAADALKYVNTSPVIEAIDHFTDNMQASGNGKVVLDLRVPIENPEATRVKGSYLINNGTVVDPDLPPLDHIYGKLEFTENSLRAQNINAQIYGGPGQFSLETGKDGQIKVKARGRISETSIRQIVNHPLTQKVHGATDWSGEVNLRNHLTEIAVRSQLVGLYSALPQPLGKSTADSVSFRFERRQQDDKQELMNISYGTNVSVRLLRREHNGAMVVERGAIGLGGAAIEWPAQRGITVNGKLGNLDWDQWSSLLSNPNETNISGDAEISTVNLAIDALDVFGRRINNLNLAAKATADGWQTSLQSKEITGDIHWQRQGSGKFIARLKSLAFPNQAPAKLSEPGKQSEPDNYPALDIVAENFEARQKQLGRLELLASQQSGDWSIEKLKIVNLESTLNMDGEWHNWKSHPNTKLNLTWEISDMGKTLDRFGYPDTIKGGTGSLSGQLKWPGSPHEFALANLGGNLQIDARKGQFLKIQPGIGRLLGILSLQSLPRRLLFDFRDVFNDGFGFDKVSASVRIDSGILRSDNFKMEGPAAKVAISGETDINRETLNLHIEVQPSLSDSLSLAALAGGPVAGAAAFVAQKLLKEPLNKLAAYQYDIIGTWDDPQEVKSSNHKTAPILYPPSSLPGSK